MRLSAEMSSPRLLSRRAPVASAGVSALERGKDQRRSIDRPLTAGSSRQGGGNSLPGSRSNSATRARPSSAVGLGGGGAAAAAAAAAARTSGAGAHPSPATSPQRRRGGSGGGGGGGGGVQYKTHAATEKFMPIHAGGNQTAATAHLSAIKANSMSVSSTPFSATNTNTSAVFTRSGGGGAGKVRPASASAAAALKAHMGGTPASAAGGGSAYHASVAGTPGTRMGTAHGSVPVGGTRPGVAFGCQSGGDVKRAGRPAMRSQLGQDLDATLDELHFQSELADASAAKLAALEEDRASVVKAYNDRLASLESELTTVGMLTS